MTPCELSERLSRTGHGDLRLRSRLERGGSILIPGAGIGRTMEGAVHVVGLRDGSVIVLDGLVAPVGGAREPEPEPGTLSGSSETVLWVGEAVAAGVTFDVLKEIALGLVQRGWSRRTGMVDAVGVTAIVRNYLKSTGYVEIMVTEIRKVEEAGWSLAGSADGARFRALVDLHGEVTHVRVK